MKHIGSATANQVVVAITSLKDVCYWGAFEDIIPRRARNHIAAAQVATAKHHVAGWRSIPIRISTTTDKQIIKTVAVDISRLLTELPVT